MTRRDPQRGRRRVATDRSGERCVRFLGARRVKARDASEDKAWPLERVQVRLRHEKIHARGHESCEMQEGRGDRIGFAISFASALDTTQRAQLLAIAGRSPDHDWRPADQA